MVMIDYRGHAYTPEEFERQFNPRANVTDSEAIQAERKRLSEEARTRLDGLLGVPYGDSDREVIDIFAPDHEEGPCFVYLHGGYWRGGHARDGSFIAEPFVRAGASVFLPTYDLCPDVTVAEIVAQTHKAIAWIHANARAYGGDPDRLYLAGHSAGAHLAAMALADDWRDDPAVAGAFAGACLISGVYDMDPVRYVSVNDLIRATDADVEPLSPLRHPPRWPVPMVVAAGGDESEEWRRQSQLYADVARDAGCSVAAMEIPGVHHWSILLPMREPDHPITRAMLRMMGLA
jgi:arylformamidase